MKQGRASRDGREGWKVEPRPRAVNPAAVAQIGSAMGNKATDHRKDLSGHVAELYAGKGYMAPKSGRTVHRSGSQGRSD